MKKMMFFLLLALSLPTSVFAAIDALDFKDAKQEEAYHNLTQELRCPQCQNNSIADSNAVIAQDMRGKVFALLQQGKSEKQVVDYMVARYGNFVTYDPPFSWATAILWILPFGLVFFAVLLLWRPKFLFKSQGFAKGEAQSQEIAEDFSAQEQERLQKLLNNKEK